MHIFFQTTLLTSLAVLATATAAPERSEPTLVYREYLTSIVPHVGPGGDTLTTYKLDRRGDGIDITATLAIEVSGSDQPNGTEPPVWAHTTSTTFTGRVEPSVHGSKMFELRLSSGPTELVLACAPQTIAVADPGATRIPDPKDRHECGNRGAWSPAHTTTVAVIECADATHDLVFGSGAGLEQVDVRDDCIMSGRAVRKIASGGRLAPARGHADR